MPERPSVLSIIRTDYLSSVAVIFPAVAWAMALFFWLAASADAAWFASFAAAVTAAAVPVLLWRAYTISNVLTNGVDVPGVVSNTGYFRGRGRITYVYSYQGEKLESSNAVQQNKRTKALAVGSKVTVALDLNRPKLAFIRDLYI